MKKVALYRKTFRLIEVLAALILASHSYMYFGSGFVGPEPLLFCLDFVCLALMFLGLVFNLMRKASWWAILACGWALVALRPVQVDGVVLTLLAAYMIYDSGTLVRNPLLLTTLLATGVLVAQGVSLLCGGIPLTECFVRAAAADVFLIVLGVVFSRDVVGIGDASPPTLCLKNYALSEREVQILHLVWGGESSKEVASFLGVSDGSVRVSLSKIYRKLGITHGKQLLQLVFTHRIVFDDDLPLSPRP